MAEASHSPRAISLRELLPGAEIVGASDVRVTSCCADPRHCRPGDLFVALHDADHDGHADIPEAIRQGASAVLADRPSPGCPIPTCYAAETRAAYGLLCQALAGDPSRRLKVVGVTGAYGKTTTSYLIAAVLSAAGRQPGVMNSLGYCDGCDIAPAPWSTPPAPVLATWLARMAANACTHAVVEVSGEGVLQSHIAGIDFDVACVTNVRRGPATTLGAARKSRAASARMFDHLLPEGFAVVNADDASCPGLLRDLDGPVLTIGIDQQAEVSATPIERFASEQTFLLSAGNDSVAVRTRLVGRHNIYNCLMATAVGLTYGLDLPTIARGLESVDHLPYRLERVECGQPFSVFLDQAQTADALGGVLETLRETTLGRLICVFGAEGLRRTQRERLTEAVAARADLAVRASGAAAAGETVRGFADRGEAIRWSLAQARRGDCVLIAGPAADGADAAESESRQADDRERVRQWLYDSARFEAMYRAA